jgi:hypothetical protein
MALFGITVNFSLQIDNKIWIREKKTYSKNIVPKERSVNFRNKFSLLQFFQKTNEIFAKFCPGY